MDNSNTIIVYAPFGTRVIIFQSRYDANYFTPTAISLELDSFSNSYMERIQCTEFN